LVLESFRLWISNSQDNTLACWIKDSRTAICLGTLDMELLKIGVPKITILVLKPMVLGCHHFRKPSHNQIYCDILTWSEVYTRAYRHLFVRYVENWGVLLE
jgi:hypothetical protein